MNAVPVRQFAEDVFAMMKQCVADEYKDATEAEREQALARIMDAWSAEMFQGPKEKNT